MSEQKLQKNLTVFQGIAMAVSLVIGSGMLGLPGLALEAGGIAATSAGWVRRHLARFPGHSIKSPVAAEESMGANDNLRGGYRRCRSWRRLIVHSGGLGKPEFPGAIWVHHRRLRTL
jgi:hypothetical protein